MKKKKLKNRSLCKLSKEDISDNLSDIVELIIEPKYLCMKCARAASNENMLCKPSKI